MPNFSWSPLKGHPFCSCLSMGYPPLHHSLGNPSTASSKAWLLLGCLYEFIHEIETPPIPFQYAFKYKFIIVLNTLYYSHPSHLRGLETPLLFCPQSPTQCLHIHKEFNTYLYEMNGLMQGSANDCPPPEDILKSNIWWCLKIICNSNFSVHK